MTKQSGYITDSIISNFDKFNNSLFGKFFDPLNPEVLTWSLTVMEKLYARGELPFYLDRETGSNNLFEDEDFISFWNTKAHFFAILVIYARLFENIEDNDLLKLQFLKDIGLYVALDQTSSDLDYLYNNYIAEFGKRGTNLVLTPKGDDNDVDGELLRLINYTNLDEFVFALLSNAEIGWNLNNSSPTYKGTDKIINLTKAYELTEDVVDLSLYPLENSGLITLNNGYIEISNPGATDTGLRYDGVSSKKIVVDPKMDYEFSFRVTLDSVSAFTFNCNIGVDGFNSNGNSVGLVNDQDGSPSNNFYLGNESLFKVSQTEYWFRGVIFNKDHGNDPNAKLNLGYGNNLRFTNNVNFITPKILFNSFAGAGDKILLRDFKFRPLSLPFSLGMLGVKNFIVNYLENSSGRFNSDIQNIASKELLPYNCIYNPIFINEL